jgi:hypothetical protein
MLSLGEVNRVPSDHDDIRIHAHAPGPIVNKIDWSSNKRKAKQAYIRSVCGGILGRTCGYARLKTKAIVDGYQAFGHACYLTCGHLEQFLLFCARGARPACQCVLKVFGPGNGDFDEEQLA